MGGASNFNLPPGFHISPSDEELVVDFLRHKASLLPCHPDIVPTVCMNHHDPWELNDKALEAGNKWYFFSHAKQSRVTPNGYWSSVCADETVSSGGCSVGLKKTLVFSTGEPSDEGKGTHQTNWVMHEFHLLDGREGVSSSTSSTNGSSSKKLHHPNTESNNWVICRVFDSTTGESQLCCHEEEKELSFLDELFLSSLDDYDEEDTAGLLETIGMERSKWMYELSRMEMKYLFEVKKFVTVVKKYRESKSKNNICPCSRCKNCKAHEDGVVLSHLIRYGFVKDYIVWTFHGEKAEASVGGASGEGNSSSTTNVDQALSSSSAGGPGAIAGSAADGYHDYITVEDLFGDDDAGGGGGIDDEVAATLLAL